MYARLYVCKKCCCMFSSLSLSVCKTSTHPPTYICRERMIITRARIQLFAQSFTLLSHLLAARVTTTKPPLMAQMTSTHMAAGVRWLYVCLRTNTHTVVWRHPHTCDVRPLVTFSHTRTTSGESAKKTTKTHNADFIRQMSVCFEGAWGWVPRECQRPPTTRSLPEANWAQNWQKVAACGRGEGGRVEGQSPKRKSHGVRFDGGW